MRKVSMLLLFLLPTAACSTSAETTPAPEIASPVAIVANSDLAVGPQRLLLGLRSLEDAAPLEQPDRQVEVQFYAPDDQETPVAVQSADFIWLIPEFRGVYATTFDFPIDGLWGVKLRPSDLPETNLTPFQVFADAFTPDIGDDAPRTITPTLSDAPLDLLTTDRTPDTSFYELSLDKAISSGAPTVVVFATPAFCQTATCGPTLDTAKSIRGEFPAVHFVHVEVFDLSKTPDELVPVAAVDEWRLPTEPWVFVVDGAGVVAARFEGAVSADELRVVLNSLS